MTAHPSTDIRPPSRDVPTATDEKRTPRDDPPIEQVVTNDDPEIVKPGATEHVDYTGAGRKTDPEEIRLVRKLDIRIMVSFLVPPSPDWGNISDQPRNLFELTVSPLLFSGMKPLLVIMYFLNYIDRNAIAQARLNDIEVDLGMNESGTDFNTAVSILFVG